MKILLVLTDNFKNACVNPTLSITVDFLYVCKIYTVKVCMNLVEILPFFSVISCVTKIEFLSFHINFLLETVNKSKVKIENELTRVSCLLQNLYT